MTYIRPIRLYCLCFYILGDISYSWQAMRSRLRIRARQGVSRLRLYSVRLLEGTLQFEVLARRVSSNIDRGAMPRSENQQNVGEHGQESRER